MKLLVCVVNDPDLVDDIISGLVEVGVKGATVMESQGMGKYIADDIPIFATFKNLVRGSRPFNHTIFSAVEDSLIQPAIRVIEDICALDEIESPGVLFTVPVENFKLLSGKD